MVALRVHLGSVAPCSIIQYPLVFLALVSHAPQGSIDRAGPAGGARGRARAAPGPVLPISRDWSRSEIKSCNPKNQIWDNPEIKWYLSQSGCGIKSGINTTFLARNCGSVSVAPELTMPPRRTGFNEYMPQGQRTLTEVDGVVEIGPVGPATQKEVAPAQANTSRKRDAELRQQHSQQQPVALLVTTLLLPKAVAAAARQPAATAAQQGGSSGKLGQVANINTTTPNKPVPPSVINLVSPDLVPPSPPSGAQANPIDAETDQVSEGKHRRRAIFLD